MTCPKCGTPNPADFMFCLQCGDRLSPAEPADEVIAETRAQRIRSDAGGSSSRPSVGGFAGAQIESRLRVEQGSVDEQMIALDRPSMIVGRRREGSDIVIHDTNVSRKHAVIETQGERVTIEDTNSSNGTVVNDERIESPVELRPGDVIRIGDAVFVFEQVEAALGSPEGSTMAIDLDSPMTSLGGAPELVAPGLMGTPLGPLTPPPAIMDPPRPTAISDSFLNADPEPAGAANASASPPPDSGSSTPPKASTSGSSSGGTSAPSSARQPARSPESSWSGSSPGPSDVNVPGGASLPPLSSEPAWASGASNAPEPRSEPLPSSGPGAESVDALRRELSEVGSELVSFAGTLGGLADRVERLERALDDASGDLNRVSEAMRGPDATVLRELQGILDEIERDGNAGLDEAMQVLGQLAAQPRDIELLLKLSQQAGALETALRIHGRLVAVAPRVRASLARLVG